MVQVASEFSAEDLFLLCQERFGTVKEMRFHRNAHHSDFANFYLVEFECRHSLSKAIQG